MFLLSTCTDIFNSCLNLSFSTFPLQNDIVDKEVRLHHMNKNYERLKDACLSLSKKTGIKLGSTRGPQLDDLCRILTKSHLIEPTGLLIVIIFARYSIIIFIRCFIERIYLFFHLLFNVEKIK